jgi:hypothetical protein
MASKAEGRTPEEKLLVSTRVGGGVPSLRELWGGLEIILYRYWIVCRGGGLRERGQGRGEDIGFGSGRLPRDRNLRG